jgi:hypothetical protein
MPSLTELRIQQMAAGQNLQLLASVRWPALRSLDVRVVQLDDCWFLQTVTQLKKLSLGCNSIKGMAALAQLTGLTSLQLRPGLQPDIPKQMSAAEQSELGSALSALTNLQNLRIGHAPPGPITQALAQLTALTELTLARQYLVSNPGPVVLPGCVNLSFELSTSVQHVASIQAPQLQHLDVSLTVQPSELTTLRQVCRGVLTACSSLSLRLGRAWSKEDTVALMTVLSQDWQPSAEALHPSVPTHINHHESTSSGCVTQCSLELWSAPLDRQCLSLLPKGLAVLSLK